MALSTATLLRIAPQFAGRSDLAAWLSDAELAHTAASWASGAVYDMAMACYAAHYLTGALSEDGTVIKSPTTGPVAGKKIGDLAVTYGTTAAAPLDAADADFMSTSYGARYLTLRATRPATMPRLAFG